MTPSLDRLLAKAEDPPSGHETKQKQSRSIRPEVFCKKCVLRNFAKFTGKHLDQIYKVAAGLQLYSYLKSSPDVFSKKCVLLQICCISTEEYLHRSMISVELKIIVVVVVVVVVVVIFNI